MKQYDSIVEMVRDTSDAKFADAFEKHMKEREPEKLKELLELFGKIVREQNTEIERLRNMIDQTADGELLPDCEVLFCPHCTNEVDRNFDWMMAACNTCTNPDNGQAESNERLPLAFTSCYSTKETAQAAKAKESSDG